jgi:hypothetical protein
MFVLYLIAAGIWFNALVNLWGELHMREIERRQREEADRLH